LRVERALVIGPSVDDAGVLSPDGSRLAFVSRRDGYEATIWTLDLATRLLGNLTTGKDIQRDANGPDCYFLSIPVAARPVAGVFD
jgi:hypothetical protein